MDLDELNPEVLENLKKYANTQPEREVAGFLVESDGRVNFVEAENECHINDQEHVAVVGGLQYILAEKQGDIQAFFHSHVGDNDEQPSEADKLASKHFALPFIIFSIKTQQFSCYEQD